MAPKQTPAMPKIQPFLATAVVAVTKTCLLFLDPPLPVRRLPPGAVGPVQPQEDVGGSHRVVARQVLEGNCAPLRMHCTTKHCREVRLGIGREETKPPSPYPKALRKNKCSKGQVLDP
uniref:Uncharacterized protein n=1 Tax=Eutreptiella gymnastica TaxID=73025 RepID=A0A7S4FZV9_9EUGL